jgi:hypothetical protein
VIAQSLALSPRTFAWDVVADAEVTVLKRMPPDVVPNVLSRRVSIPYGWPTNMLQQAIDLIGSPARTRTTDPVINSHLLYRLSYWGSTKRSGCVVY